MWGTKCALIVFDIRNSFETVIGAFDDETAVLGCTVRVTDIVPVYPIDR
jgi:predicted sulfurtransferase